MVVVVRALIGVDPGCSLMRRNYLESNFTGTQKNSVSERDVNASCFSTMEKANFLRNLCQNECLQFSVCLSMYGTEVLRACNRFFVFVCCCFLCEVKERA